MTRAWMDRWKRRSHIIEIPYLISRLRRQWLPASSLPQRLVHSDVHLRNVCQTETGRAVYLDFGFLVRRPRIHDLAYSLAFMVLALHGDLALGHFAWQSVPQLVEEYEVAARSRLTVVERRSLVPLWCHVGLWVTVVRVIRYVHLRAVQRVIQAGVSVTLIITLPPLYLSSFRLLDDRPYGAGCVVNQATSQESGPHAAAQAIIANQDNGGKGRR